MADYRPLIVRAISRLASNTAADRQSVYAQARTTLVELLNRNPPFPEAEIERERHALEDAILRVELGILPGVPVPALISPSYPASANGLSTAAPEKDRHPEHDPGEIGEPQALSESAISTFFNAINDETFDFRFFEREGPTCSLGKGALQRCVGLKPEDDIESVADVAIGPKRKDFGRTRLAKVSFSDLKTELARVQTQLA